MSATCHTLFNESKIWKISYGTVWENVGKMLASNKTVPIST